MLHEWRKDCTNIRYLAEATPDTADYINGLLRMQMCIRDRFERHIAVVDAAHHVYAVDKFHEVDGIARPLKKAGGGFCCVVGGY